MCRLAWSNGCDRPIHWQCSTLMCCVGNRAKKIRERIMANMGIGPRTFALSARWSNQLLVGH